MLLTNNIAIIADDLTGANDTALQFLLRGCNTQILFDYQAIPEGKSYTQAWAISTETRNEDPDYAARKVYEITQGLLFNFNFEHVFKKIDSTLRGNIAHECWATMKALDYDAAVIVPAFPAENRTTIGGYQMLKGVPVERTEFARDPQSPIFESHIPTLLRQQVKEENYDDIDLIQFSTVTKGAGPILVELQSMIQQGKKLIVIDAMSKTDLEQIALAVKKCTYKVLPCGAAGLAQAFAGIWLADVNYHHIKKVIADLPVLIVSGSATDITKNQLMRLEEEEEVDAYFVKVPVEKVFSEPEQDYAQRIADSLKRVGVSVVQIEDFDCSDEFLENHNITKTELSSIITDFLGKLTRKIVDLQELILVSVGGETSYKCCHALDSKNLQLIDEVEPAIPLCLDYNSQWVITKSGNLGNPKTLINIVKYLEQHK